MVYVILDGYAVKRVTDMAVLIVKAGGKEEWVPRSTLEQGDLIDVGDTDLAVAQWFAKRTNLDY